MGDLFVGSFFSAEFVVDDATVDERDPEGETGLWLVREQNKVEMEPTQ